MVNRFGGGFRGTVFERLASLRQEGTVEEFVRNFEVLTGQTRGIPEEQVLGYFLVGLREDVKGQVRIQNLSDLMEAMRVARDVEDAMVREQGGFVSGFRINPVGARSSGGVIRTDPIRYPANQGERMETAGNARRDGGIANANTRPNLARGNNNHGRMVRNLPYPEFLKRKEGRCFRCGGPFAPGHHCAKKSLRVLLLAEDEEEEVGEEPQTQGEKLLELSACSAEGLTSAKTLKLTRMIG